MRIIKYNFLKKYLNLSIAMPNMQSLRNLYACLGASCVLVTYMVYLYKSFMTLFVLFSGLLPLLPVLIFVAVSFGIVIANYTFLLTMDIFDIIAHYLVCGSEAICRKNIEYEQK